MSALKRIIGIDPGSRKTGFGVVEINGRKLTRVAGGVLRLPTDEALEVRLGILADRLGSIVDAHRPDIAAVEEVFVRTDPRAAIVLGQARGAAVVALAVKGLDVTSWSPTAVKSTVTGRGRASKAQVAALVTTLLGLDDTPPEDEADALAVALCPILRLAGPVVGPTKGGRRGEGARASLEALAKAQGKI